MLASYNRFIYKLGDNDMDKMNKAWETPQLIILARGMPEENVLQGCKAIGATFATQPEPSGQLGCDRGAEGNCATCPNRGGKDS